MMERPPQPYAPALPPRLPTDLGTYVHRELQRIAAVLASMEARLRALENPPP